VTTYSYNPVNGTLGAGGCEALPGPLANSNISYSYDQLGRVVNRSDQRRGQFDEHRLRTRWAGG